MRAGYFSLVLSLAFFLHPGVIHAGTGDDSTYAIVVYVGGGLSQYMSAAGGPPGIPTDVSKMGAAGTVRVMWHPDHLLRVGLETGRTQFYSYTLQQQPSGTVDLSGVPVLLVWSMHVLDLDLFLGTGYYQLHSELDYQGDVDATTWSMGWMASAAYTHPLSEKLGVAGELKWMNVTEHEAASLTAQVQLVWRIFEW